MRIYFGDCRAGRVVPAVRRPAGRFAPVGLGRVLRSPVAGLGRHPGRRLRPPKTPGYDHGRLFRLVGRTLPDLHHPPGDSPLRCRKVPRAGAIGAGFGHLLRLHQPVDANPQRLPLHHPLRRVRQGGEGAEALHPRHQRGDRRADRRRGRNANLRRANDHAQVRHRRTAGDRRQLRPAPPQPRPAGARHPQPPPHQQGHRPGDLRPRSARVCRPVGRPEAGGAGQAPPGQADHQRLQSQQGRPAAGRHA